MASKIGVLKTGLVGPGQLMAEITNGLADEANPIVDLLVVSRTKDGLLDVSWSGMNTGDLSAMSAENLVDILEIEEEDAKKILQDTLDAIEKGEIQLDIDEEDELISASAIPAYQGAIKKGEENTEEDEKGKFSDAEKRLREELAAFKLK